MPLIKGKSKKAVSKNIETEMNAGKPQDQSIAIAMDVARHAKKAAHGGMMSASMPDGDSEHYEGIADAILAKRRKARMMAEGGMVDSDNEETPAMLSPYNHDNADAVKKELYEGDDDFEDQPMDSNEKDVEIDSDDHDMVSKIRKKMRGMGR